MLSVSRDAPGKPPTQSLNGAASAPAKEPCFLNPHTGTYFFISQLTAFFHQCVLEALHSSSLQKCILIEFLDLGFFFYLFIYNCIRSWLWHVVFSLALVCSPEHVSSTAVARGLSSCDPEHVSSTAATWAHSCHIGSLVAAQGLSSCSHTG